MSIIGYFVNIVPILILAFSFFRFEISLFLFICYSILVPLDGFNIGPIHLGNNFLYLLMFIPFIIKGNKEGIKYDIYKPFITFYAILLVYMAVQYRMPIGEELKRYRQEVMSVFLLPIMIYSASLKNPQVLNVAKIALIISGVISIFYGIFLKEMPMGINPYLMYLEHISPTFEYKIEYAADEGRAISRIFSTMASPQAWAYFLGIYLFFVIFFIKQKIVKTILLVLTIYNILFCGVRTVIVAAALPVIYYFVHCGLLKIKTILQVGLLLLVLYFVISSNADLYDYLLSITGSNKSSTVGSDSNMRLLQLEGCFDEIRNNPLFGNGFRWTAYYNETYGNHPKSWTFESLVFVILACWGYVGFIVWGYFFFRLYRQIQSIPSDDKIYLIILFMYYVLFTLATGEYCYIIQFSLYYAIFYSFILADYRLKTNNKIKK